MWFENCILVFVKAILINILVNQCNKKELKRLLYITTQIGRRRQNEM